MKKCLVFFFFIIMFSGVFAQSSDPTATPTDTVAFVPVAIPVNNINIEAETAISRTKAIAKTLEISTKFIEVDSLLRLSEEFLTDEANGLEGNTLNILPRSLLNSLRQDWVNFSTLLGGWQNDLNNRDEELKSYVEELSRLNSVWDLTSEAIKDQEGPNEIRDRIKSTSAEIISVFNKANDRLQEVIVLEDRITEQVLFINENIDKINVAQSEYRQRVFRRDSEFILTTIQKPDNTSNLFNSFGEVYDEHMGSLSLYVDVNYNKFYTLLVLFILILIMFYALNWRMRIGKIDLVGGLNDKTIVFLKAPLASGIFLSLMLATLILTNRPFIVTHVLMLGLIVPLLIFIPKLFKNELRPAVYLIIFLYILETVELFLWFDSILIRCYILGEMILAFLFYSWYLRPQSQISKIRYRSYFRIVYLFAILVIPLTFIAVVANIVGYFNLSGQVSTLVINSAASALIIFTGLWLLQSLAELLIRNPVTQSMHIMKNYMYVFEKRLNGILSLLALFLWIRSILHSLDLYNVFTEWLNGLLDEEWKLGTTTISFGGILGFITVVLITYLLTRFVKLVVEEELFMRIKMPRGIPQAISLVIRYIIVVFGIYLALAAAGVDLDRFGLIAGALGVGIGFGLQNIVNNFIAGLILVFERPIQVGDTVEVGTLLGRVKRIGVRSSNVRTYDGAEVIVPNGNLTSKEVINWTLSDQVRRIEVKVGVAYGSDPNTVLEILKKITNEHENVLDEPPPLPLFVEFGDSSLNFRVLFWVYYEQGLSTRSDITIRLYNELDKAGITIPFPQRDLNFKAMQPKDKKKLLDALKDEEEDL